MTVESVIQLPLDDRFDRFRRIDWWDQDKLSNAKVLVIGAGALGNEVLKNLALLGVGNVFIADSDRVETSNLSRSVLFRDSDVGRAKSEVAAASVRSIYPEIRATHFEGNVVFDLGLGVYRWADLVIAGLDNREARLHVNRCCYRVNRPWVDAATEALRGVVRVFMAPEGACYECTMSANDWHALKERRGCAGLRAVSPDLGRVATTPITTSILAAIQVQEALKILHGMASLSGQGLVADGLLNEFYTVAFHRNDECNSHESLERVIQLDVRTTDISPRSLLDETRKQLGARSQLDLMHELLIALECPVCKRTERILRPMASISEERAFCGDCGSERRPIATRSILGHEEFADFTFAELGFPPFDIVSARHDFTSIGFEFSGDSATVLKSLQEGGRA